MDYLFIANGNKLETNNVSNSYELNNFSIPCIEAALKEGYNVYMGVNRRNANELICKEYPIKFIYLGIFRNVFNIRDVFGAYKRLCQFLYNNQIDVIHCNTPIGGLLGRICGHKFGVRKIIYTVHGFHFYKGAPSINNTIFKWIEQWLAHYTDVLITINREDYKAGQKFHLRNGGKICYVPGVGIDTKIFINSSVNKNNKYDELSLPQDAKIGIVVGDLNDNKNVKTILRAVAMTPPCFYIIICGIGPQEKYLKNLTVYLGISNRVHFLGYRCDVNELYAISDIFLFASKREGLPRSLMEAMCAGLPCVVSKIRGNVDLIDDNKGGYLVHPLNHSEFAKKINLIISNNELGISMGDYNQNKIKKFSVDVVKQEILSIYNDI